ncbi:Prefoldin subunit 4 [Trichinella nativa]|uniref:Prefoldin subunit n=1 Tax=Trichinella nativa TaxID=6335 RepID=A0A0V1LR21_9BILA|nr:Prefoldin subunit 4 [Trichinella sp. T6]KRZ61978.1 Prefoldin subunit 4 [Trichinella nativa]OUC46748.1 prefoldin subunit [Trichinella nativa]
MSGKPITCNVMDSDQKKISEFSVLNARLERNEENLRRREALLLCLKDAADEILLVDENDSIPMTFGDCFVHLNQGNASSELEFRYKALKEETDLVAEMIGEMREKANELKVYLYSKFGDAISLDRE